MLPANYPQSPVIPPTTRVPPETTVEQPPTRPQFADQQHFCQRLSELKASQSAWKAAACATAALAVAALGASYPELAHSLPLGPQNFSILPEMARNAVVTSLPFTMATAGCLIAREANHFEARSVQHTHMQDSMLFAFDKKSQG